MTIVQVLARTLADGGGTFDARTREPIENGPWAVGGSLPGRTIDPASGGALQAFRLAFSGLEQDGARTIGTWLDEGVLYVDAIDLIDDTDEAIRIAAERGERAIYHLTNQVTLEVSRS